MHGPESARGIGMRMQNPRAQVDRGASAGRRGQGGR